jgi:selenocysteine lyase/cysteine desulfurase
MEHNAVMRPLVQLEKFGVDFSRIPGNEFGELDLDAVEGLIRPETRAIVMTHASNIVGTVNPLAEVGKICRRHGLRFIVDSAQTAGILPISMKEMNIDALCFTGHKSLLGPQGTGGFIIQEDMIDEVMPILTGGTGSVSHTEETPDFMPDKFEPGTMNLPGIAGLHASLGFLAEQGIETLRSHELSLTERFLAGLRELERAEKVRIVGRRDMVERSSVVSIVTPRREMAEVAYELDENYGIMTRVGLHCAPSAHKTLGTFPTGTIRFSFGFTNTDADVDVALAALDALA